MMQRALVVLLLVSTASSAQTAFLDNATGIVNGSTTYDPETRTCGHGRYAVFTDIDDAAKALAEADVLYVREGTYSRPSVGNYITVHGNQVNYWTGALAITTDGTPEKRKLVSAYEGEHVIIQAKPGVSAYNPDPADETFINSSHFYPNPAISISGAYVDVVGFKTYGQVVIARHDVTVEGCDLGGGGPHMNQGQVVALNANREGGVYNVVLRNNLIHHSCWGESRGNGAAVMGYNFSCIMENNTFYDNYGADVRIKDTGDQQGRDVIVRYNFFGPSSLDPKGNTGTGGLNQDKQIDRILIHNNVFYGKALGASVDGPPPGKPPNRGMFLYKNTFIDCTTDLSEWTNPTINAHNNLFYHSQQGQRFYDIQTKPWSRLDSDSNLFFSVTGDTRWLHLYRNRGTTLAAWQQYSSWDQHSVWKDPRLVNPAGSRPEDFKRKGDPRTLQDVAGSKYGPVCGAYETGSEIIGPRTREQR